MRAEFQSVSVAVEGFVQVLWFKSGNTKSHDHVNHITREHRNMGSRHIVCSSRCNSYCRVLSSVNLSTSFPGLFSAEKSPGNEVVNLYISSLPQPVFSRVLFSFFGI